MNFDNMSGVGEVTKQMFAMSNVEMIAGIQQFAGDIGLDASLLDKINSSIEVERDALLSQNAIPRETAPAITI